MATKKRFSEQNEDKYSFGWDLPVKWEEGNISGEYSLPEINIYPNNKFGDIARSQGLETARNWRKVKEGTTAGINRFASPVTEGAVTAVSFSPAGDAIDAMDFYNAAMKGDGMGMALAGLGFVPVVGNVAKKTGKAIRRYGENKLKQAAIKSSEKLYDFIAKNKDDKFIRPILEKADDYFEKHPKFDKEAMEFYESDVIPRAKKYQDIDFVINPKMFEYRYKLLNMDYDGVNISSPDNIYGKNYIKLAPKNGTIVHEARHSSQLINKKPGSNLVYDVLSKKSENKLNSTYVPDDPSFKTANDVTEKEANNTEMRYLLWKKFKKQNGRVPTVEELDNFIDNMDSKQLIRDLYMESPYMYSYISNMDNVGMTADGAANFIREALKYVPAIGGAALVLPYSNSNNENKRRFDYDQ